MTEIGDAAGPVGGLLVSAGQVLIGPAGRRIAYGAVLVVDGRIAAVGERGTVAALAPPGTAGG